MAKPSIFSRDYEKKMKSRRRKTILFIFVIVVAIISIFLKVNMEDTDFSEVKANIQAWIDSDKPKEEVADTTKDEKKENTEIEKEVVKVPEKTYIDLNLGTGVILKAEYSETNGEKKFVTIEGATGIEFAISPLAKQILITDKNQDLKLFSIDGVMKDVTKKSYVSQDGMVFPKEDILKNTPIYLWHSQARFIDETRIVYVSQMPYFGDAAVNKYVWIYDTVNLKENAIWNLSAPDTKLGVIDPVKGIEATINGVKYYINGDGVVTQ